MGLKNLKKNVLKKKCFLKKKNSLKKTIFFDNIMFVRSIESNDILTVDICWTKQNLQARIAPFLRTVGPLERGTDGPPENQKKIVCFK